MLYEALQRSEVPIHLCSKWFCIRILCQELGTPFLKKSSSKGSAFHYHQAGGHGDENEEMVLSQRALHPGLGVADKPVGLEPLGGRRQVPRLRPLSQGDGGKASG